MLSLLLRLLLEVSSMSISSSIEVIIRKSIIHILRPEVAITTRLWWDVGSTSILIALPGSWILQAAQLLLLLLFVFVIEDHNDDDDDEDPDCRTSQRWNTRSHPADTIIILVSVLLLSSVLPWIDMGDKQEQLSFSSQVDGISFDEWYPIDVIVDVGISNSFTILYVCKYIFGIINVSCCVELYYVVEFYSIEYKCWCLLVCYI